MTHPVPLSDWVSNKAFVVECRRSGEQDEWEISKCHTWPPIGHEPAGTKREDVDDDPFSYFVSSDSDREEFSGQAATSTSAGSSTARPYRQRSKSFSPADRSRRFSPAHSPTSSAVRKLQRWLRKMEQQYQRCPVLGQEIVEITPKCHEELPPGLEALPELEDGSDMEDDSALPSPSQTPDQDLPTIIVHPPEQEEASRSPISPPWRGRPVNRAGSGIRARARRRSWKAPSYELGTIPEEAPDEIVGLGIEDA